MVRYILKRILSYIPILILISIMIFFIIRLIPGDPVQLMFGKKATAEQIEYVRALYGLDKPLWQQYITWATNILKGDWGTSIRLGEPVIETVLERLPRTALLCFTGIILSIIIAVPSGIASALRHNTAIDMGITSLNLLFISIPSFLFGILLIIIFAVILGMLPSTGYVSILEDPVEGLRCLVLPTFAMAGVFFASLSRLIRSSMLEVMGQDYITLARVKGVRERTVLFIHALKNALIPAVTVIGLQIGYFLGGEVVVEKVFAYPGMGTLLVNAISQRDYPLVQATVLVFTIIVIIVNLLTDITYILVDPKIKFGAAKL